MTAKWESECHWMRLIDLEGETNFTLQNRSNSSVKGQNLGLCLWFLIFLSPHRVSPFSRGVITRARVSLGLLSLQEIWGPLVVYVSFPSQKQIDGRVLIPFVRCQAGPKCLSMSLIFDLSIFFIFSFFLESRISQLISQYWKLLSGASVIYHSNFTLWPLSNVILKQNWVRMKAS